MKRLSDNLELRVTLLLLMCFLLMLVKRISLFSEGPEITHDDLPMRFDSLIFLPSLPY